MTPDTPIPFKPEAWPVDADGFTPNLCTVCGTPTRYGSRHTQCAPGWQAPATPKPEDATPLPEVTGWSGGGSPEGPYARVWIRLPNEAPDVEYVRATQALTAAARDVLAERQRQITAEEWTPEHDDEHDPGELSAAGSAYALAAADELHPFSAGDGDFKSKSPDSWPWAESWWKPGTDPRRMLVKAGALILAEIERLDRAAAPKDTA